MHPGWLIAAVSPTLLDSSFLIALEREIESGRRGLAMQRLRRNRGLPDSPSSLDGQFLKQPRN